MAGLRIEGVEYWDIYNFGDEARKWDHGDWHHAVMGVALQTSSGPVSVLWTDSFYPYGVEALPEPMTSFLRPDAHGPESWSVIDNAQWRERAGQPLSAVQTHWERLEFGPSRFRDGAIAEPPHAVDLPAALRLDFPAGPVWFIAGIPQDDGALFIPGDEIVVAFTTQAMLGFGFPADPFTFPNVARPAK